MSLFSMGPVLSQMLPPDSFSLHIPPKKGAPFGGTVELVQESGSERVVTQWEISRDGNGRIRMDWDATPPQLQGLGLSVKVAMILDHVAGKRVVLNRHSKTATRSTLEPPPEWNPIFEGRWRSERRELQGLLCVGGRVPTPSGGTEETWASEELGIVVAWKAREMGSSRSFRFLELVKGEVDPALFQIPADYAIVEER